jgi:hypothetical protein
MTISAPLAPHAGSRGERSSPEMRVFAPNSEARASARTFIVVFEDERSAELQTPAPGGAFVDIPCRRRASPPDTPERTLGTTRVVLPPPYRSGVTSKVGRSSEFSREAG